MSLTREISSPCTTAKEFDFDETFKGYEDTDDKEYRAEGNVQRLFRCALNADIKKNTPTEKNCDAKTQEPHVDKLRVVVHQDAARRGSHSLRSSVANFFENEEVTKIVCLRTLKERAQF